MLAGVLVLPGDDLLHALRLDQAEGGGELAHPEVEAVHLVLELAVVAELAGELDQLGVGGDQDPALPGGDRLGRVERVDAGVAEAAGPAPVPARRRGHGRSPRAGRSRCAAVLGDALGVEGDVAADVDEDRRLWPCRSALRSKSAKDMQRSSRLQSTNSTSAPALIAASGEAMKVFEGQSTVSPPTPANSSAARAPRPSSRARGLATRSTRAQRCSKASSFDPPTTARNRAHRSTARTGGCGHDGRTRSRIDRVGPGDLSGQERRQASTETRSVVRVASRPPITAPPRASPRAGRLRQPRSP